MQINLHKYGIAVRSLAAYLLRKGDISEEIVKRRRSKENPTGGKTLFRLNQSKLWGWLRLYSSKLRIFCFSFHFTFLKEIVISTSKLAKIGTIVVRHLGRSKCHSVEVSCARETIDMWNGACACPWKKVTHWGVTLRKGETLSFPQSRASSAAIDQSFRIINDIARERRE